ncbi:118_t:CDS:2 [Entrophospora sp. SA101]|nr:118_t:CDS:2 [Entrophospora sp. SA101]
MPQEQSPTVIVMNPTTQILHFDDFSWVTPQKSLLFKESITYLQNHIKMNVNDQGMIIKDNHASVDISSIIRNWLATALSSTKEEFVKAIMAPLSSEANPKDHDFVKFAISGGPENTDSKRVKEDSEKLLKEAVFGLVSLL